LSVTTASNTPTGSSTLTVTGTSGSLTHSASARLVVNSPQVVQNGGFNDGTLNGWTRSTANGPTVVSGGYNSSAYAAKLGTGSPFSGDSQLTQSVTIPGGNSKLTFAYQAHCPDTLTYDWFNAEIVKSDGTVTSIKHECSNAGTWVAVSYDTSTFASQTVTLRFTAHDDNYASDPTYYLVDEVAINSYIPPPPAQDAVANGGFESGALAPWTASGAYLPAIKSGGHSGSYSAQVGSTSPVNGNSTLVQRVTVPSGSPTLTYWYQPHCPDTLTYDQIQMQVKDTAGTVLATVMNVCSNSGAWTQVTFSMSAYAGKTVDLAFNDHDDGYASDPTYFLVDDVSLK
jgi:hypothetical protein